MKAVDPILPVLRARARRMTGNVNDGDDLVQDTLVRAWRYRDRFEPGSNLKAWMIHIERNSFLSDRRRARPTAELPPDYAHTGLLRVHAAQETTLHMEDLERAVRTLPKDQHDAFVVAQGGKRYREASQQLGISERALKSRVARARSAIARSLDAPPIPLKDVGTAEPARPTLTRYEEWKRSGSRTIG